MLWRGDAQTLVLGDPAVSKAQLGDAALAGEDANLAVVAPFALLGQIADVRMIQPVRKRHAEDRVQIGDNGIEQPAPLPLPEAACAA